MSVVIAIKKNDRIYMAADTQTSCGDRKVTYLDKGSRKIHVFDNGMLLGHSGAVHNGQIICAHPEYFTIPEDGVLTKKHIVQNIIPKMFKCYRDNKMLETEDGEPSRMGDSYILAYKDKMFRIFDVFDVAAIEHFTQIGSGGDLTLAGLVELDSEDVTDGRVIEERLTELLGIASSRVMSVSSPYYLIDTVDKTFKLIK